MTEVNIIPVEFSAITPNDLRWLARLNKISYDKASAEDMLEALAADKLKLFRFSGVEGIILLALHPRALWIEGVAGQGLLTHAKAIADVLTALRLALGKSSIQGITHRPGLRRLYERMGHRAVATVMEAS